MQFSPDSVSAGDICFVLIKNSGLCPPVIEMKWNIRWRICFFPQKLSDLRKLQYRSIWFRFHSSKIYSSCWRGARVREVIMDIIIYYLFISLYIIIEYYYYILLLWSSTEPLRLAFAGKNFCPWWNNNSKHSIQIYLFFSFLCVALPTILCVAKFLTFPISGILWKEQNVEREAKLFMMIKIDDDYEDGNGNQMTSRYVTHLWNDGNWTIVRLRLYF